MVRSILSNTVEADCVLTDTALVRNTVMATTLDNLITLNDIKRFDSAASF